MNQITLMIPPLRDRNGDVPLLIRHYLEDWNHRYHEQKSIDQEAIDLLLRYPWPGNVRELANAVGSMCAASMGDTMGPSLLPRAVLAYFDKRSPLVDIDIQIPAEGLNLPAFLHQLEGDFYRTALERTGGNGEQAARLLGINGPAFRKAWKERFGGE